MAEVTIITILIIHGITTIIQTMVITTDIMAITQAITIIMAITTIILVTTTTMNQVLIAIAMAICTTS